VRETPRFTNRHRLSSPSRHVGAVVLAAGGSARLGVPKQLINFRGEPLVRRAARSVAEGGAAPVVVVTGADAADIALVLDGLSHTSTVVNEQWRTGLASSLATAVRELQRLDARADGVLIATADQPLVDASAFGRLLAAFAGGARVVAAEYSGTIGVPAVIGREHFETLLALEGDAGAGRWLRARGKVVQRVPLLEAAVDIDTAEDAALLASLAAR
jgi:CTP:molybdopterin cytidylyltransferase MocA